MKIIRQPRASTERDITNTEALMIALLVLACYALGWLWFGDVACVLCHVAK